VPIPDRSNPGHTSFGFFTLHTLDHLFSAASSSRHQHSNRPLLATVISHHGDRHGQQAGASSTFDPRFLAGSLTYSGCSSKLQREYKAISANPPPYIRAHPSASNILEWHYLIEGPPDTPYEGGQYWGTLTFPAEYPFKPPAIRMITPSGRFQTLTRLCLSISDFHPKTFNPGWEVSTILVGLLSFMTSEEKTTGSISASERVRMRLAQNSRLWNSTGGGSVVRRPDGTIVPAETVMPGRKVGLSDGGKWFRSEWPEVDVENWKWCDGNKVLSRGIPVAADAGEPAVVRKRAAPAAGILASGRPARGASRGEGWLRRYPHVVGLTVVVGLVLVARVIEMGTVRWRWS